jgi:hypothetical protein
VPSRSGKRGGRVVTNAERDAMAADRVAGRATMIRGRQRRVVPAPRCRCQDGDNQARSHRGAHVISRNTIAQGRPDRSADLWWTYSCAFSIRTRGYGCCLSTRLSLRPLVFEGHFRRKPRVHRAARMRRHVFHAVGRISVREIRHFSRGHRCCGWRNTLTLLRPTSLLRCLTSLSESATGLLCVHRLRTA